MTDYGHELRFGVFITPTAAEAGDVVELARLAELAGLDLVTFQDHPYQPRFLDTWTLLSVVAAQTSTVRVAPNVANLPLRPPAVLARSVASLDLLSGGRVELGPRRRRVLGRDRGHGRAAAHAGPERRRARGGDRGHPRALGRGRGSVRLAGEHYASAARSPGPRRRTPSRSGSAPTSRACCALTGRAGRRLAAEPGLRRARTRCRR